MLNIKIICVGKLKEKYYIEAYNEYIKRLSRYCKIETIEIQESVLDKEADTVLECLNKLSDAYVICLCIEGILSSSGDLAKIIYSVPNKGYSKIVFIIGGSDGLSERVKNVSNYKLSMSKMTFPHHLARVILSEQIYRSFKIIEGSAYHK